ncbi:MAG: SDR family oxidoreductase [Deltaproteobacteria bacterium]|nr:SDR family oxidoreductase [Deltaproteobacteria bacterium]
MTDNANFMNWSNPGTALITGASAGLGAEFARQLARQGFKMVLVARRKERLEELADELGKDYSVETDILVADLSNPADNDMVMEYISKLKDLDVLINNAGFGLMKDFFEAETQSHVDMINVHCTAPVQFCHKALPGMKSRGRGVIINVSSIAALTKSSLSVMYTPTKEFINVFSQMLQPNLEGTGVRIQSLCPGFTYTEFHDVEEMKGFDRNWFSKEWWMTAEEVVSMSLDAFKEDSVVFVPGEFNQDQVKKYLESIK